MLECTGVCALLSFTDECQLEPFFAVGSSITVHCHVTFCHICEFSQEPSRGRSLKYDSTVHLHVFHVGEKLGRNSFSARFIELLGFQYCIRHSVSNSVFLGLLDYSK